MGLPSISITFQTLANSAIQRSSKGTLGIIIKDALLNGPHTITRESQIESDLSTLGEANRTYLAQALLGYTNQPKKLIVYILPQGAADLSEALDYFAGQVIDYIVGPPDIAEPEITEIKTWIVEQRKDGFIPKAVLPEQAADNEAIINFTTAAILVDGTVYSTAQYCARIAGLIAGTPMTTSCTYAPLPEVENVAKLSKDEMDAAVDAGEFIIFHDGTKVKVGRGVNSYVNASQNPNKGDAFKKIKIVEALDMINSDIRMTAQDTYIGKYTNSYDNKCLLIAAINDYFTTLEREGILASGKSSIGIDIEAQEKYLQEHGIDTSEMSEQEIKEANTGSFVFLAATVSVLDAIEDIRLNITI